MLSNLDPASQRFLADLNRIQLNNSTAQQQLTSGLKVQSASDAPDQISSLLQLQSDLSSNTRIRSNLGRVQTEVNAADDSLNTGVLLLDKITQLTAQGLSSDSLQVRAINVQQIQDLQQQLVSLSETTVEGRFIFDGGDGSGQPYSYDVTAPNGTVRLRSTAATRQVQDSAGEQFSFARSAQDIFDERDSLDNPTANNIFAAITQAITALTANNNAAISSSIDSLHIASTHLGTQQSFYGRVQNHLATALDTAQSRDVSLNTQIGSIRDADSVEASIALTRGSIGQQAALAAEARSQTKSLFDYLA